MSRFNFEKIVELPLNCVVTNFYRVYVVGRFVGTSFRKVASFTDESKVKLFLSRYSGKPEQFLSDFVCYKFDLSVSYPDFNLINFDDVVSVL